MCGCTHTRAYIYIHAYIHHMLYLWCIYNSSFLCILYLKCEKTFPNTTRSSSLGVRKRRKRTPNDTQWASLDPRTRTKQKQKETLPKIATFPSVIENRFISVFIPLFLFFSSPFFFFVRFDTGEYPSYLLTPRHTFQISFVFFLFSAFANVCFGVELLTFLSSPLSVERNGN